MGNVLAGSVCIILGVILVILQVIVIIRGLKNPSILGGGDIVVEIAKTLPLLAGGLLLIIFGSALNGWVSLSAIFG